MEGSRSDLFQWLAEGSAALFGAEAPPGEETLRRSDWLRVLIDTLPYSALVEREGRVIYANGLMLKALGLESVDQIQGRPSADLVQPGDLQPTRRQLEACEPDGRPSRVRTGRLLRSPASPLRIEMAEIPLWFEGAPSVALIAREEEADQQMADRFRVAVESSPTGMLIVDAEGTIILVNREAETVFGYQRQELLGRPIEILLPERHRKEHPDLRRSFVEMHRIRGMAASRNIFGLRKDGSEVALEIGLNPVETEEGVIVLCSILDIEERRKARSLVATADRMASVGTLAAGVAHGINNPLTYVMGNLSFALEELDRLFAPPDESGGAADAESRMSELASMLDELRDALAQASEGSARIRDLVADLVTFSSRQEIESDTLDLHAVVESALNLTRNEIRHRARLVKRFEEVPCVKGDPSQLAHVMLSLLINAAQAIPEGEAEENEIRVSTWTDPSGAAVVEICDTGPGIAPEILGRLFEPFFTTKPVGSGTGLGLAVAHGIVSSIGGEISVESTLGRGSAFQVRIPPTLASTTDSPPHDPQRSQTPSRRILLVDDEPHLLSMLQRVLARLGGVLAVEGGREALELIQGGARFDVILCDLMMPDMTGMDLFHELRLKQPELAERVVFITGGPFTSRATAFLEQIDNRVIAKPLDPEALVAAIRAVAPWQGAEEPR
jgi:PAS domain S-box-containing protein